jgi:hypothetical protein
MSQYLSRMLKQIPEAVQVAACDAMFDNVPSGEVISKSDARKLFAARTTELGFTFSSKTIEDYFYAITRVMQSNGQIKIEGRHILVL